MSSGTPAACFLAFTMKCIDASVVHLSQPNFLDPPDILFVTKSLPSRCSQALEYRFFRYIISIPLRGFKVEAVVAAYHGRFGSLHPAVAEIAAVRQRHHKGRHTLPRAVAQPFRLPVVRGDPEKTFFRKCSKFSAYLCNDAVKSCKESTHFRIDFLSCDVIMNSEDLISGPFHLLL